MRKRNDQQFAPVYSWWRRRAVYLSLGLVLLLVPPVLGQRVIYVNSQAVGANDGMSWIDAYADLQDALDDARTNEGCPCKIWVAEGWYKPDRGTGDRMMSFELASGVALYGGFAGREECREERDPAVHRTVLSGDLLENDDPAFVPTSNCCYARPGEFGCDDPVCTEVVHAIDRTCVRSGWYAACSGVAAFLCCDLCRTPRCDNSYNVLRAVQVDATAVLEGFEIRGGEANGYPEYPNDPSEGGGIFILDASPLVDGCTFVNNAGVIGSAVLSSSFDGAPIIRRSVFENNYTYSGGGAVDAYDYPDGSIIVDCVFRANGGVGLATNTSQPIENVAFIDNYGTGLRAWGTGTATIKNCSFIRNEFGGMKVDSAYVLNCEFRDNGNAKTGSGGGIHVSYSLVVVNSVFAGNTALGGGAIAGGLGSTTIINSTFVANEASTSVGGGVALGNGRVVNSIFWGNHAWYGTLEEMQITVGDPFASLAIDHSIVQGWTGAYGGVGNNGAYPMFLDPFGPDVIIGTEDDDLRLSPFSPAINAGNPDPTGLPATDLDGHARVLCGRVDIGAYEFGIGDFNCDQAVDLFDFSGWSSCMTGPQSGPYDGGCEALDFNADSAIDLLDFATFAAALSGR